MSMDFDDRDPVNTPSDSPLFGATPVWERGRKRRGFGARRPAEPRTFTPAEESTAAETPMTLDRPLDRPMDRPAATDATITNSTLAASTATADEGLVAPIGRDRTTTRARQSNSAAPAALAVGGLIAVAALAGVGWYATRGSHDGVPEITPGAATSTTSNEVATLPVTQAPAPPQTAPPARMAAAAPANAAPVHAQVRVASVSHTRHAASARGAVSAEASGSNASAHASLPDAPQPYRSANPAATPAPVAPAAPPPPPVQQAAPAAPESIPSTPPIAPSPAPAPAQSQPTPPDTQAPPTSASPSA
jgi:hypothetical protein